MILHEGNQCPGGKTDIIHGTNNMITFFRNYFQGHDPNRVNETNPIIFYPFGRYHNVIGNVLGDSSYHTNYETGNDLSIYKLNSDYGSACPGCPIPADSKVASTVMRWGNYDTVNAAVRWQSSEVPSGISPYPVPVPATHNLPRSLYLAAKPSWWLPSSIPFPTTGPDVNCASNCVSNVGGHVIKNPAWQCFDTLTDDTNYPIDASGFRPKHFTGCPYQ
jgi:hypothetical protein